MNMNQILRLAAGLVGLTVIAAIVYYQVSSSIQITVTGGSQGAYSYHILNQGNGKVTTAKSNGPSRKQRLSPGTYELMVTQADKTSFQLLSIRSYFGKTDIAAALKAQQQRTFVGDDPASCMSLLATTFISKDCSTDTVDTNLHVAPTLTDPGYIDTDPYPLGHIESAVATKGGAVALFGRFPPGSDTDADISQHVAYLFDPNAAAFQPTQETVLADLDQSKSYALQPYKDGFIAYDSGFTQVFYYASIHAKPTLIAMEAPKNDGWPPVSLSVSPNDEIAITYSVDAGSDPDYVGNKPGTEVVVNKDGKSTHFSFDAQYSIVQFCGGSDLCMLSSENNVLEVNDVSGAQAAYQFSLHGVRNFASYGDGLIAVRDNDLLQLDTTTETGFTAYSFGGYSYCGLDTVIGGHVACLTNSEGRKTALFISNSDKATDNIDKQVLALQKDSNVSKLSIVRNIIYVVPKGENIFNTVTDTVAPDPVVQGKINQAILKAAIKAGINLKSYHLIITKPL